MTIFRIQDEPDIQDVLRGIYPILSIDPETDIESMLDWAMKLPPAGIKLVQVRLKRFAVDSIAGLLDELVNDLRSVGLTVILNDYVELVNVTGADGVHIGIDDFPIFEARALLGQKAIIGATVRNHADALLATGQGASYVAAGSIYKSPTKSGIPIIGIDGLKEIMEHIDRESMPRMGWGRFDHVPVCAIGGINVDNIDQVYDAGASMVAVISAIQSADDPVSAAHELVSAWDKLN